MKILVLAGGLSPEREVSLNSGSLIATALMKNGHRVLLLDVYLGIRKLPDDPETLFLSDCAHRYRISEQAPDLEALRASSHNGNALIGPNVLRLCGLADKVFLALHGSMGENGQLQATLDTHGISYTGSGYVGSLLAMDKDLSKRLFRLSGVPTADWVYFDVRDGLPDDFFEKVGLPCVVKPCDCGSSVGVSIVETEEELCRALKEAARWGRHVLIEKKIVGRELTVGILAGKTLPAVEIIPNDGFYDYKNKYQGTTREICPAELDQAVADEAARLALLAFDTLRLKGYARADFLLDEANRLWCLEVNTLPGMTPTSLLPLSAAAAGISYGQLCETILSL